MRLKITSIIALFILMAGPSYAVSAASLADVTEDKVTLNFPETATFSAQLSASATITSVTLEYGNEQQTCGEVVAKAFPQFNPSTTVDLEWTWDMRQSGSLPPGSTLWWRWRYADETGQEYTSETQTATWLDDRHDWETVSSGNIRLHWYDKDESFAQTMLDAGLEGLRRNEEQAGLTTDSPVDIYVYPNYNDMQDAILYEPSWTGGMAFPEHNIVIMGISGSDSAWDRNTVIHELTHVLVGHFTFSCIGTVPTWLNEGLAMFSEGELDSNMRSQLDQAIQSNTLIPVRSMNGGFSELPDKANLSYSESYSITKFLIDTYGQEKMTDLLVALRDAMPVDDALLEVYGFDTDGLEDGWRQSIGAVPRAVSAQPTAMPTPTHVPTYVPVSGAPLAITPTPWAVPTSSFTGDNDTSRTAPPIWLTLALLGFCCVFLLILGVIVLGVIVRTQNSKRGQDG
jgi:hypothetical protein